MTIVLALGNDQQILQLSDRRLSAPGRIVDEESNKCGVLECLNGRFAFGYTGLASCGSFRTMTWLLETLSECAPPTYVMGDILKRFVERATQTFNENPALRHTQPAVKRLSVMFSGYLYPEATAELACAVVSNFEDVHEEIISPVAWPQFKMNLFNENKSRPDPVLLQYVGNWTGITASELERFADFLTVRKPSRAIVDMAVNYLRRLADRPVSARAIGKQLSSILISPNRNQGTQTAYHSSVLQHTSFMPAIVVALPGRGFLGIGGTMTAANEDGTPVPVAFPKVHKNAPCPCGSKIRYKNCHGRRPPHHG